VGSLDEIIRKAKEAIDQSEKSIQNSKEQRETQSGIVDSILGHAEKSGRALLDLADPPRYFPALALLQVSVLILRG
jgi:hypothetical protein